MNTGNKIKVLGSQLQTCKIGNRLFKLVCSFSLLLSQSKWGNVLFFFPCNQYNFCVHSSLKLYFTWQLFNRMHYTPAVTSCLITSQDFSFSNPSSITTGSVCLNICLCSRWAAYVAQPQPECALSFSGNDGESRTKVYVLTHTHTCRHTLQLTQSQYEVGDTSGQRQYHQSISSSSRLTFKNALAVQHVSRDNHRVEVLGETWSTWRFEGLACLTPLGNKTRQPVKDWQIDLRPQGQELI